MSARIDTKSAFYPDGISQVSFPGDPSCVLLRSWTLVEPMCLAVALRRGCRTGQFACLPS